MTEGLSVHELVRGAQAIARALRDREPTATFYRLIVTLDDLADKLAVEDDEAMATARQFGHECEVHRTRARALRDTASDLLGVVHDLDREASDAERQASAKEEEKRARIRAIREQADD